MLLAVRASLFAFACLLSAGARAGEPAAPREQGRQIVLRHCGSCHVKGSPQAVPAALAVFDLTAANWSAELSERRLVEAKRRLSKSLSEAERKAFDAFIAAELAAR